MRIFIASSGERLNTAIEVGSWLESMNVEPVLWNEPEVFPLGVYTWDALIDLSKNVDAAVFIFGEDDKIWFRGEGTMTVRDNVLLEYGLCNLLILQVFQYTPDSSCIFLILYEFYVHFFSESEVSRNI